MPVNLSSLRWSLMLTPLSSDVELPWHDRPMIAPAVAASGRRQETAQRLLVGDAGGVVVPERRVQLLAFVGVAQAQRQIDRRSVTWKMLCVKNA